MYTLLFHKPELIQKLMRPVRHHCRRHRPSTMCPAELLRACGHRSLLASLQGLRWNLRRKAGGRGEDPLAPPNLI